MADWQAVRRQWPQVETKKLTRVLTHVLPKALVANPTSVAPIPGSTPARDHFVHVEAGIVLEDLMTLLDRTNRAPATMGGAAGQTLAGVISTCVHGSHFHLPPFPDWIRAIHLIGPDGRQYWIISGLAQIVDDLQLPHPLHLHCNNLGNPGNVATTIETMRVLEGRRWPAHPARSSSST